MAEIAALIAKLEALDGPSREVDNAIFEATEDDKDWLARRRHNMAAGVTTQDMDYVPLFTASIDAAVALGERKLPGHTWRLMTAALNTGLITDGGDLARFYIIALLRAMEGDKP